MCTTHYHQHLTSGSMYPLSLSSKHVKDNLFGILSNSWYGKIGNDAGFRRSHPDVSEQKGDGEYSKPFFFFFLNVRGIVRHDRTFRANEAENT